MIVIGVVLYEFLKSFPAFLEFLIYLTLRVGSFTSLKGA